MALLYVYPKRGPGFSVELGLQAITLGRAADNAVPLSDPFCSGRHAVIRPTADGYLVEDAGSKNGTFLNGRKLGAPMLLRTGDEIRLGGARIVFDRPLSVAVEMTDESASITRVNTVVPVQDLLRRPIGSAGPGASGSESSLDDREIAAVLGEVSQELLLHRPLEEMLDHIMDLINVHVSMDRGVLMLFEGEPPRLQTKAVRVNSPTLQSEKIQVSRGIAAMAIEGKLGVMITDAAADPRFMARESIMAAGIRSALCVPLWNNKAVIGVLYADRLSLARAFTEKDLRLLTLLANLAAVKIENVVLAEDAAKKDRMERELALAAKIQKDLLPKEPPACAELDIAGRNVPCLEVGGDYYDFIPIDDCRMGIAVADVSGKGVSASLLMASLRAALHSEMRPDHDLAALAAKLSAFVLKSSPINNFITFFWGELDRKTGRLCYINAGHPAPVICGPGPGCPQRLLEGTGLALGMLPGAVYEIGEEILAVGETWILYTDGITESRRADGEEYGPERLAELACAGEGGAADAIDRVFAALESFSGTKAGADDRTLVVIKRIL
ncbi:MAG: SpoIIE family protein phosphatase [Acidobacteriota bacterium]|nr:SpoIIE family protein phosphatase [Acidobacteriota bacterium]